MPQESKVSIPDLDDDLANAILQVVPSDDEEPDQKSEAESDDEAEDEVSDDVGDPSDEGGDDVGDDLEDEDEGEEDEELPDYGDEEGDDEVRDTLYDVTVDGKQERVTLDELKASYSGNAAIQSRLQQASEERKKVQSEAEMNYTARQEIDAKLRQLDQIIQSVTPVEPDWNALQGDPAEFQRQKTEWDLLQQRRAAIYAEAEENDKARKEQEDGAMQRYLAQERESILEAIPSLANEEVAAEMGKKWFGVLQEFGFTQDEFANVNDHRMLRVVHALSEAKDEIEKLRRPRKKTRRRQVKTSVRPNARTAQTRSDERQRRADAARKRAERDGTVDNVAATLIVQKPT